MITPLSLTAAGKKLLPRSVIVPLLHKNPWSASVLVCAQPTTWPRLLIAAALACGPPKVPRSVAVPFCHSTACSSLLVSSQLPAIWLVLLIALAPQPAAPGVKVLGSGSWATLPLLSRQAWLPGLGPHVPAIWPESLIPA